MESVTDEHLTWIRSLRRVFPSARKYVWIRPLLSVSGQGPFVQFIDIMCRFAYLRCLDVLDASSIPRSSDLTESTEKSSERHVGIRYWRGSVSKHFLQKTTVLFNASAMHHESQSSVFFYEKKAFHFFFSSEVNSEDVLSHSFQEKKNMQRYLLRPLTNNSSLVFRLP